MTPSFADAAAMVAALRPEEPVVCLRPQVLRARARRFVDLFPGDVLYAVKCNDHPIVLRALHDGGIRQFDTASPAEVALVDGLFDGDGVCHYMHPVKSPSAIAAAYCRHHVRCFALDHPDELAKIMAATGGAQDLTLVVRVAAPRHQAIFDLGGKFGATVEAAAALLRECRRTGNRVGITFHAGSQCLAPEAFRQAIALAGQAVALSGEAVAVFDVGGGFPAAYVGVNPPPLEAFIAAIREGVAALGLPPLCRLVCEPGRALVAEGASVVVRVELRRDLSLHLNDGMYGCLSDLRLPGFVMPMRLIRPEGRLSERLAGFALFGPTCDSSDAIAGPYLLPEDVRAGDWIEIGQLGAYSTVFRTRFNGLYSDHFVLAEDAAFLPAAEAALIDAA